MGCEHHHQNLERREDKYGQNFRLSCNCGQVFTAWHTSIDRARIAFDQNFNYLKERGRMIPRRCYAGERSSHGED